MNSVEHALAIVFVAASLRLGVLVWLPWRHIAKCFCNIDSGIRRKQAKSEKVMPSTNRA